MIYLSGAITSTNEEEHQKRVLRFYKKTEELRSLGMKVYNPCAGERADQTWEQYLAYDLKWIYEHKPDTLYLMVGWQESRGARLEYETALLLNMKIIYES